MFTVLKEGQTDTPEIRAVYKKICKFIQFQQEIYNKIYKISKDLVLAIKKVQGLYKILLNVLTRHNFETKKINKIDWHKD